MRRAPKWAAAITSTCSRISTASGSSCATSGTPTGRPSRRRHRPRPPPRMPRPRPEPHRMRIAPPVALLAAGLLALAGCGSRERGVAAGGDPDLDVIRKAPPAWAEAFNKGDADAIVGKYWDDATIQPPHAPASTGRAAIREHFAADIRNMQAAGMTLVIPEA